MQSLDFFEQALSADQFYFLECIRELLKETGGGAETRPRLRGRLQTVDGLQQSLQIQRMRLGGLLIGLRGPGKTMGESVKIEFPGGGFNPVYSGGHEQKGSIRRG
jgi:hypothetical protein